MTLLQSATETLNRCGAALQREVPVIGAVMFVATAKGPFASFCFFGWKMVGSIDVYNI